MAEINLPENGGIRLEKIKTHGPVKERQYVDLLGIATSVLGQARNAQGSFTLEMSRQKMILTVELPKPVKPVKLKRNKGTAS
jgi:hypothetical protein